jgi:hypothetical protein
MYSKQYTGSYIFPSVESHLILPVLPKLNTGTLADATKITFYHDVKYYYAHA